MDTRPRFSDASPALRDRGFVPARASERAAVVEVCEQYPVSLRFFAAVTLSAAAWAAISVGLVALYRLLD